MFKFAAAITLVLVSSVSFANNYKPLCTRHYVNDIFNTDLRLAVSKESDGQYLWIDTHIPYGIRPLPYLMTKTSCTDSSLNINADSTGIPYSVNFAFTKNGSAPVQTGTVSYYDENGTKTSEVPMNCDVQAIQNFCAGL